MQRCKAAYCVGLAAVITFAGCGRSDDATQVDLEGAVAFDGKAVPGGTLLFQPQSGKAIIAVIDENGRYKTSAPIGQYQVAVVASTSIPDEVDPWKRNTKLPPPLVPDRFGRPETSGTSVNVSLDNKQLDITLK
jgi:hypothetical protein